MQLTFWMLLLLCGICLGTWSFQALNGFIHGISTMVVRLEGDEISERVPQDLLAETTYLR